MPKTTKLKIRLLFFLKQCMGCNIGIVTSAGQCLIACVFNFLSTHIYDFAQFVKTKRTGCIVNELYNKNIYV